MFAGPECNQFLPVGHGRRLAPIYPRFLAYRMPLGARLLATQALPIKVRDNRGVEPQGRLTRSYPQRTICQ